MTCRKEILEIARELAHTSSDGDFTAREILVAMRERGLGYADNTVRVHIASIMCKGCGNGRLAHFDDFERIGRGVYQLAQPVEHQPSPPKPAKVSLPNRSGVSPES